jgi:hypothetical protein
MTGLIAQPLSRVRFPPELPLSSTAKAGERFEVPFGIEGAAAGHRPDRSSPSRSRTTGRRLLAQIHLQGSVRGYCEIY